MMELPPDHVHVWSARLDQIESVLFGVLDETEHRRAERLIVPEARRQFMAGRVLLRCLLARYGNTAPDQLRFHMSTHGKPVLADADGLGFNLSHSGNHCICAVAMQRELGVDIEEIRPRENFEQLAERFFAERETSALLRLAPEQRLLAFFQVWTRKEALVKALGTGIGFPLEQFAVSVGPDVPARIDWARDGLLDRDRWRMRDLHHVEGCAGCLVVEGADFTLSTMNWPP